MNLSQSTTDLSTAPPSPLFSRHSSSSKTGDFDVIPPSHPSWTFVLCFNSGNGLGRKYDTAHSNLDKFVDLLKWNNCDQQSVFNHMPQECYGIHPTTTCPEKLFILLDKDIGDTLGKDIMSAYGDLMQYYQSGDSISLFGFSRGAYTARALAEMIHKVGLLPTSADIQIYSQSAYFLYVQEIDDEWHKSFAKFKELKPIDVRIDFVGVWDTVPSVGDVVPRTLPFSRSNTSIRVFRHGLALHEPRARLHPKLYEFDTHKGKDATDVREVWFAGSHCDIGGCAVPEDTPHSLGRIPLRWMVRECFKADTGIQFRAEGLREIGLDPASLYPVVADRPRPLEPQGFHFNSVAPRIPVSSEEEHDVRDALSATHDQFTVFAPLWWMLELLPIWRRVPVGPPPKSKESTTRISYRMSLPRGLVVPKDRSGRRFYVHPTVRTRMQAGL